MRALVQRVESAEVRVDGQVTGRIGPGLLVYLGVAAGDDSACAARLAEKVAFLRIFDDAQGKLNLSVRDAGGAVLAVSNFALLADARKGRRPAFAAAAPPEIAQPLYDDFVAELRKLGCTVACGVFRASMAVLSTAVGPVNVIIDYPAPPDPSPQPQGESPADSADRT
ncbi:MAG: D-aminoacyl-tRNA deacylase [Phycisphaerae bacterium]